MLYKFIMLEPDFIFLHIFSDGAGQTSSTSNSSSNNQDNSNENSSIIFSSNDKNGGNLNNNVEITDPAVNINIPNINVKIPGIITGLVGGAAIKAGMEIAKHTPSIPGKIATTVATAALAAGGVTFGSKVGGNIGDQLNDIYSNSNIKKNFFPDISPLFNHVEGLDKYPLNLLEDLWLINYSGILFLIIILNVFISIYLKNNNIDIFNYLPKWFDPKTNKIGKIIQYIYNRYLYIWYENRKFFLIYSWCMLMIALLLNQLGLFIILNSR
jgi:hypothetical protein